MVVQICHYENKKKVITFIIVTCEMQRNRKLLFSPTCAQHNAIENV